MLTTSSYLTSSHEKNRRSPALLFFCAFYSLTFTRTVIFNCLVYFLVDSPGKRVRFCLQRTSTAHHRATDRSHRRRFLFRSRVGICRDENRRKKIEVNLICILNQCVYNDRAVQVVVVVWGFLFRKPTQKPGTWKLMAYPLSFSGTWVLLVGNTS